MELKLTRRRFGQLAIAGTVIAVLGNFQRKVFSQISIPPLVVAITPLPTHRKGGDPTRLIVGPSPSTITISGLKKKELLESLVGTKDGRLLGLVVKKNGRPPVRLVEIDQKTGDFTSKLKLPENQRFSNLAECPDGKLYTTGIDKDGKTRLLLLDLQKGNLDF